MHGFEGFLTIDKNLQYLQHITKFPLKIFVLDALNNKIETLKPFVQRLKALLQEDMVAQILVVKITD